MNILALFGFKRSAAKRMPAKAPRSPAEIVQAVVPLAIHYQRLIDAEIVRARQIHAANSILTLEVLDQLEACESRAQRLLKHLYRLLQVQQTNRWKAF